MAVSFSDAPSTNGSVNSGQSHSGPARMPRLLQLILDLGERLFVVLLAVPFLWAFAKAMPTHPNLVLIAASEMLAVAFILTRKGGQIASSPVPIIVGFLGTALPLLARPVGSSLVPTFVSSVLMVAGLGLSVLSKLYLNRSFGLVAANRGVKMGGPYRLVRHPMYLGYMVNQVGFLLGSFSFLNVGIYAAAWAIQLLRIREEEKVLLEDPGYRQLADRVSSRLIPGVF